MAGVDGLSKGMRDLVREFGLVVVHAMIEDGYHNAKELRPILVEWRRRRQEQWLATDFIVKKSARQVADAMLYAMAERAGLENVPRNYIETEYDRMRRQQQADDAALFAEISRGL
jgi:hypothetical protein